MHAHTRVTAAVLVAAAGHSALADIAIIRADYLDENFASSLDRLFVTAHVDLDSVTGIGVEDGIVVSASVARYINDVGQNFSRAVFSDPPDLTTPGNMFAGTINGEVDGSRLLGTIRALGGNDFTLLQDANGGPNSVASFSGSEVVYGGSVIFTRTYILDNYTVEIVPAPATGLPLLGLALVAARRPRT